VNVTRSHLRAAALVAILGSVSLGGCVRARSPQLVWEGAGAAHAGDADALAASLTRGAGDLGTGTWGESPDATFQLLETRTAERPHVHDRHDLTVVILRGRGTLVVSGRSRQVVAGDVLHVARGRVHHFHPSGTVPVLALAIFTPRLEQPDNRPVE
jgi:mannose-6-phosphate isomerase-like protein (cupin superfamily)